MDVYVKCQPLADDQRKQEKKASKLPCVFAGQCGSPRSP